MQAKLKGHVNCTCRGESRSRALNSDILPVHLDLLTQPELPGTEEKTPAAELPSQPMVEIEAEVQLGPMWLCDCCWERNREDILSDVLAALKNVIPKELGACRNVAVHPELYANRDFLRNVVTILVAFGMTPDGALTLSEAPRIADLVRTPIRSIEFREADWRNSEPGQLFLPQIMGVDILSVKTFSSLPRWYANLFPASSAG